MDSTYSAGDLRLDILGFSENAIASIDKTVKSLNALSRSINKISNIDNAKFVQSGDKISILLNNISKAINSINIQSLSKLSTAGKAISNISKIGNLGNADYEKVGESFGTLTKEIEPFINRVKGAEASLTAMYRVLSKTSGKTIFSQNDKNLDVSGIEKLSSIGTTGKAIQSIGDGINKLNSEQTVFAIQQISNLFEKLSVATTKIDKASIEALSSIGKSVNSISKISSIEKIDFNKVSSGFSQLSLAIKPFINEVKSAETSLNSFYSENAIASIDRTVKSLNSLSLSINKINSTQFVYAGDKIEVLFNKIAKATNSINTKNLDNLAVSAKALASISKIGNLSNMDFGKVGAGFTQLAIDIKPFINEVKNAEASLTSLYGVLSRFNSKKSINTLPKVQNSLTLSSKSFTKGFSNMFGLFKLARWTSVIYMARRLGGYVSNIVQDGADYTETLNLWRVSMGQDLIPQATEFVSKMNEAYGVSEKTLMNAQAIFKNMLGSLGEISDTMAYSLSEGITQMALDYASLYNQSFDQAFTKFQAALAGQVRPIRSVSGYDITENTLFQLYQSLGGEKTMRQLSRTEKQLLSIYAIFQQMERSGAIGDLDRTMESFANQSRVFKDSWNDVKNYAGVLLTYVIQESGIFTKINAGLIFLSELLKTVATSIGAFEEFDDPFAGTEESAALTAETVDDLNNKLLDFDKIRALNQSSDINALGIDVKLIDAFSSYRSILEKSKMEARELANIWLENIGLIDQNKDGIIDMQEAIGTFNTKLGEIDFNKIGQGFSNQTSAVLQWFNGLIDNLDWSNIGKKIGDFINGVDWADLGIQIMDIIFSLSAGLVESIVTAMREVDWDDVFKEVGEIFVYIFTDGGVSWLESLFETVFGLDKGSFAQVRKWYTGSSKINLSKFASGGLPDKGSMFVAGEAGAEYVYNMPSGQSGVANIQQIAQATYSGTMQALNDWWGGSHARGDIPQLQEASATGMYQAVTGVARSYGERWDKY